MYVKKDGTVYWFISHKAQLNFLKLEREARFMKWTGAFKKGTVPKAKREHAAPAEQPAGEAQ